MIAAGLEDDGDIKDAVGVTEEVYLDYPNVNGLGHFTKRTPVAAKNIPVAPEDDEDNPSSGLLADEEEDDEGYLDFEID